MLQFKSTICNLRLVPLQTEMERLSMRVDDILDKIKTNRESFNGLMAEQESIKALLGQLARFHGMDYEEEDGVDRK